MAADLDMHQLILQSEGGGEAGGPIKTAEEVLREIEEDEESEEEGRVVEGDTVGYRPPYSVRSSTFIGAALQGRRLEELSVAELTNIYSDIEVSNRKSEVNKYILNKSQTLVRELSEELVTDLGSRDELEFEKELKNNFISLLLSIQSKRRQQNVDGGAPAGRRGRGGRDMKYLTTVGIHLASTTTLTSITTTTSASIATTTWPTTTTTITSTTTSFTTIFFTTTLPR